MQAFLFNYSFNHWKLVSVQVLIVYRVTYDIYCTTTVKVLYHVNNKLDVFLSFHSFDLVLVSNIEYYL